MKLKVLITGRNKKVARDISSHLENDRGYLTVKCNPAKGVIYDIILAELPKVVIACLGNETPDTIKVYNVLKEAVIQGECAVIVIANDEDEKLFVANSDLYKVLFLSRPVSLFALYEKLNEIEDKLISERGKTLSAFREHINDRALMGPVRKKVLVVDDDTEQLINIRDQLDEFYDLTLVKSGDDMFRYLSKDIPDLILLDYLMPDFDGPAVYKKLRNMYEYSHIPVIFLTGVSEKKQVLQTLTELRPQGYIIKPAKKSELVAKIIDVLG